jgi:hypothetical protein
VEELKRNKKYDIGVSVIQIQESDKKVVKRFLNVLKKNNKK